MEWYYKFNTYSEILLLFVEKPSVFWPLILATALASL